MSRKDGKAVRTTLPDSNAWPEYSLSKGQCGPHPTVLSITIGADVIHSSTATPGVEEIFGSDAHVSLTLPGSYQHAGSSRQRDLAL